MTKYQLEYFSKLVGLTLSITDNNGVISYKTSDSEGRVHFEATLMEGSEPGYYMWEHNDGLSGERSYNEIYGEIVGSLIQSLINFDKNRNKA